MILFDIPMECLQINSGSLYHGAVLNLSHAEAQGPPNHLAPPTLIHQFCQNAQLLWATLRLQVCKMLKLGARQRLRLEGCARDAHSRNNQLNVRTWFNFTGQLQQLFTQGELYVCGFLLLWQQARKQLVQQKISCHLPPIFCAKPCQRHVWQTGRHGPLLRREFNISGVWRTTVD
jgi:hypothetical protein